MSIGLLASSEAAAAAGAHGADAAHAAHATWLGLGPVGWLAVSTLVFVGLLAYLKVHRSIGAALDDRIARIRAQLDEAEALRREAQALLAEVSAQKASADKQAADILAHAREEAATLVTNAKTAAEAAIARRTQMANDRIAAAERAATDEVRATAVSVATAAAQALLAEKLPSGARDKLVDEAIADLDRRLH